MEVIRGIYVDSFRVKKANCIYFLTHWHAGNLLFLIRSLLGFNYKLELWSNILFSYNS